MNLIKEEIYDVYAKPKSSKSELVLDEDKIIAYLKKGAYDGKANDELVGLFKKQYKKKVEIVSGFKSRKKKIKVLR